MGLRSTLKLLLAFGNKPEVVFQKLEAASEGSAEAQHDPENASGTS